MKDNMIEMVGLAFVCGYAAKESEEETNRSVEVKELSAEELDKILENILGGKK